MRKILASILILLICPTVTSANPTSTIDALSENGHVLLLRHALAPGFGDPAEFDVNDCATQRNLSAEGVAQAKAIGAKLREAGLGELTVYTSQWCRCRDTAIALELTGPIEHQGLNSFFQDRGRRDEIVADLRGLLASLQKEPAAVLVTHQVNIRAVTGQTVRSGEGIIARVEADGELTALGPFRLD